MAKYFEVTPVKTQVELDKDGKGTVEFKIRNLMQHAVTLKYSIGFPKKAGDGSDKPPPPDTATSDKVGTAGASPQKEWFTLPSSKGEQLVPDETQPCPIKIAVPPKTPS